MLRRGGVNVFLDVWYSGGSSNDEHDDAADADVAIDDIAEPAVGNMLEHVCSKRGADSHSAYAIKIVPTHSRREESVIGAHHRHHDVAAEQIRLHQGHVLILVFHGRDKIKYGWRTLCTKESAQQSADRAGCDLSFLVGRNLYAAAEEDEIDAHQDQRHAEDRVEQGIVHPLQAENGKCGDDDEGGQDGEQSP